MAFGASELAVVRSVRAYGRTDRARFDEPFERRVCFRAARDRVVRCANDTTRSRGARSRRELRARHDSLWPAAHDRTSSAERTTSSSSGKTRNQQRISRPFDDRLNGLLRNRNLGQLCGEDHPAEEVRDVAIALPRRSERLQTSRNMQNGVLTNPDRLIHIEGPPKLVLVRYRGEISVSDFPDPPPVSTNGPRNTQVIHTPRHNVVLDKSMFGDPRCDTANNITLVSVSCKIRRIHRSDNSSNDHQHSHLGIKSKRSKDRLAYTDLAESETRFQ